MVSNKKNSIKESIKRMLLTYNINHSDFIDKGDYIEFKKPIAGILMVQKNFFSNVAWADSDKYAQGLRLGGYNDWLVPSIKELQVLYTIKNICAISPSKGYFWSASEYDFGTDFIDYTYRLIINLSNGKIKEPLYLERRYDYSKENLEFEEIIIDNSFRNLRCVRVASQENRLLYDFGGSDELLW